MNSPRSPNINSLRSLYKAANIGESGCNSGQSPSWRESYKKRCFDEFKKSRQKLMNKFRQFNISDDSSKPKTARLKDYLDDELEKICLLEAKVSDQLISIDEAADIYKQLQYELIQHQQYDDDVFYQHQEVEERSKNNHVICPLCQKSELSNDNKKFISCPKCSLWIDADARQMTLSDLNICLENAVKRHNCPEIPYFKMFKEQENSNGTLLMICENCDFFFSVI